MYNRVRELAGPWTNQHRGSGNNKYPIYSLVRLDSSCVKQTIKFIPQKTEPELAADPSFSYAWALVF